MKRTAAAAIWTAAAITLAALIWNNISWYIYQR